MHWFLLFLTNGVILKSISIIKQIKTDNIYFLFNQSDNWVPLVFNYLSLCNQVRNAMFVLKTKTMYGRTFNPENHISKFTIGKVMLLMQGSTGNRLSLKVLYVLSCFWSHTKRKTASLGLYISVSWWFRW